MRIAFVTGAMFIALATSTTVSMSATPAQCAAAAAALNKATKFSDLEAVFAQAGIKSAEYKAVSAEIKAEKNFPAVKAELARDLKECKH